jgi:hypothetical protein
MRRYIDDFVRRARSWTGEATAIARDDPAVWRVLAPCALLAVVVLLVLVRRAGPPATQVLAFVGACRAGVPATQVRAFVAIVWLIAGLTTWYGDEDDDAEAMSRGFRDVLPRHDVERPAIGRPLAVPTELRRPVDPEPAEPGEPAEIAPPAAAAG